MTLPFLPDAIETWPVERLDEEWQGVPGHPGYQASSLGRIRSISRTLPDGRQWRGRVLKTKITRYGYEGVSIALGRKDLGYRHTHVHIIIAETFLGAKPGPEYEVAHNDGSRTNNRVSNLRWTTAKGNAEDRDRHRRTFHPKGSLHPNSILTEDDVKEIREMRANGVHVDTIASTFGVHRITVYDAIARRTWGHV